MVGMNYKLCRNLMAGIALTLLAGCNAATPASTDGSSVMGIIQVSQQDKANIPSIAYYLSCNGFNSIAGQDLSGASNPSQTTVQFTDPSLSNANGRTCHIEVRGAVNQQVQFHATLQGQVQQGLYLVSTNSSIQNNQFNASLYRVYTQAFTAQGPTYPGLLYVQFAQPLASLNLTNATATLQCNGAPADSTTNLAATSSPQAALLTFPTLSVSKYTGLTCNDVIISANGQTWRFQQQRNFTFGNPINANANTIAIDSQLNQAMTYQLANVTNGIQNTNSTVQVSTTFIGDCANFQIDSTGNQCSGVNPGSAAD